MPDSFTIIAEHNRDSTNAVRFLETGDPSTHKVGTPYAKKSALAEIGYESGDKIEVTYRVVKE